MIRILVAVVPFGLGGSPRLRDHMNVTICNEATRVARLYGTEPERCVGRLRRQYVRDVGALKVLVVQGRRIKHGIAARLVRSIHIHRQPRAVPHGDTDVPFLDHRFFSARFRGVDRRRFAAASAASTDRGPCRMPPLTTLLYDRKV